jgi:hypothetical protein
MSGWITLQEIKASDPLSASKWVLPDFAPPQGESNGFKSEFLYSSNFPVSSIGIPLMSFVGILLQYLYIGDTSFISCKEKYFYCINYM